MSSIFNQYKVDRPMKVLYFQGDFPNPIMRHRLQQTLHKPDNNYFKFVNRYDAEEQGYSIDLTNEKGQENLKMLLEEYRPDFVIFDTFENFSVFAKSTGNFGKFRNIPCPVWTAFTVLPII